MKMQRREFIGMAALAGGALASGGCRCLYGGDAERVPYGPTIGDRLWMWGHHADSFAALKDLNLKESYNLPFDRRIDMAAACREMGVPGCFVVRWLNLPRKTDLPAYMKQFAATKRVGFSITDSAAEPFEEKVRLGLALADEMPNLTTLVLDDYFNGDHKKYGLDQLRRVHDETARRGMKLGCVLYADQNGVSVEYGEALAACDEVTFWFWEGKNVGTIEAQVGRLRDLVGPDKPVLLGQYMYDFGGKKPLPGAAMEAQLAATSRLLARRAIQGVIFHCTPLVDMDLDAVRLSKAWICENAARAY